MNIEQAVNSALAQAHGILSGDHDQMLVVFGIDGDALTFTFETPRFTYPMMHKTGVQVAYLHPECAVLITRNGDYLVVAGKSRDDQSRWMLVPTGDDERLVVLERVTFTSVDLFWDGVREEE